MLQFIALNRIRHSKVYMVKKQEGGTMFQRKLCVSWDFWTDSSIYPLRWGHYNISNYLSCRDHSSFKVRIVDTVVLTQNYFVMRTEYLIEHQRQNKIAHSNIYSMSMSNAVFILLDPNHGFRKSLFRELLQNQLICLHINWC